MFMVRVWQVKGAVVRFPTLDSSVVESRCHLADWAAGPRCRGIGSFSSIYQLLCLVVFEFGQDFGGPLWSIEPFDSGGRIPSRCVGRRVCDWVAGTNPFTSYGADAKPAVACIYETRTSA